MAHAQATTAKWTASRRRALTPYASFFLLLALIGAPLAAAPQLIAAKSSIALRSESLSRPAENDSPGVSAILAKQQGIARSISALKAAENDVLQTDELQQEEARISEGGSLIDQALEAASTLEQRQRELLQQTKELRSSVKQPVASARAAIRRDVPPRGIAIGEPASAEPGPVVEILERQREALVEEVIRLRKQLRGGSTGAVSDPAVAERARALQEQLRAERERAEKLQSEVRLLEERLSGTPTAHLEEELRTSLAHHVGRVQELEQREKWLSGQLKALRTYAVERRQIYHRMMESERDAAQLKIKLYAMEEIEEENERLRTALEHSKHQLQSVQEAAQTFLEDGAGSPTAQAKAKVAPTKGSARPTPPSQLGFK